MHSINVYGINNKWIDKWVVRLVMGFRTCYPQIWHLGRSNILSFVVVQSLSLQPYGLQHSSVPHSLLEFVQIHVH